MSSTLERGIQTMNNMLKNKDMLFYYLVAIVALLTVGIIMYFYNISTRQERNNSFMDSFFRKNNFGAKIAPIDITDAQYQHSIRDYYIMSSYNSCCGGNFYDDYVDVDPLKDVIGQGARVLDFEIYDIPHGGNKKAAIAASATSNVYQKGTYNYLDFGDVMSTVKNYAFNPSTSPNATDPLFLHFRLKTNNNDVMAEMGKVLEREFTNQLLGPEFENEYDGQNLGSLKLSKFVANNNNISRPNVIIMVDKSGVNFEGTPLEKYVNIASSSVFLQLLRDYDVKYTPNSNVLIDHNKQNMAITMPDYNKLSMNNNISLHMAYGCQMICMCFQKPDSNFNYYMEQFTNNGSAFILKPEALRYEVKYLKQPKKQNPELSYKEKTISKPYFKHKL